MTTRAKERAVLRQLCLNRKARPTGCDDAWFYWRKNGGIHVYVYVYKANGPTLYCSITARQIMACARLASRAARKGRKRGAA